MNLREIAEADLSLTLEDAERGFGFSCTITDPDGNSGVLSVQSGDIHLLMDVETDIPLSVRLVHVSVRIQSLINAGLGIPKAVSDEAKNPWLFVFEDILGTSRQFTVNESRPDRTLGIVTLMLELIPDAT